jgi:hypothetical protein
MNIAGHVGDHRATVTPAHAGMTKQDQSSAGASIRGKMPVGAASLKSDAASRS